MTISVTAFSILISAAVLVTIVSPCILIAFWFIDFKKGQLW